MLLTSYIVIDKIIKEFPILKDLITLPVTNEDNENKIREKTDGTEMINILWKEMKWLEWIPTSDHITLKLNL